MIDGTGNSTSATNILLNKQQSSEETGNSVLKNSQSLENVESAKDQVNISYNSESPSTYQYDMSLEQTAGDGLDLLRGLVLNIFKEQGLDYTIETTEGNIDLETLTPEEAVELVADDGYFGVEKTADRIFKSAIGFAGGDITRIDAIKEGVNNGFQGALEAFGGELPEISYDTYDAVINKLDEWAGISSSSES